MSRRDRRPDDTIEETSKRNGVISLLASPEVSTYRTYIPTFWEITQYHLHYVVCTLLIAVPSDFWAIKHNKGRSVPFQIKKLFRHNKFKVRHILPVLLLSNEIQYDYVVKLEHLLRSVWLEENIGEGRYLLNLFCLMNQRVQ